MELLAKDIPFTSACLNEGVGIGVDTDNPEVIKSLQYQFNPFGFTILEKPSFFKLNLSPITMIGNFEDKKVKHVICFGAGIDSTVLAFKLLDYGIPAEEICLLYIDYNGPWSKKEAFLANQVFENVLAKPLKGCKYVHSKLDLVPSNLINGYIIPGRNGMVMELAYRLFKPQSIMLAANYKKDDASGALDKGRIFFGQMTDIFSKEAQRLVQCWSPVLHQTKLEALLSIKPAYIQDILQHTTSCYDETNKACGVCYACFKRNLLVQSLKEKLIDLNWFLIPHVDLTGKLPEIYYEYAKREKQKGRRFTPTIEGLLDKS